MRIPLISRGKERPARVEGPDQEVRKPITALNLGVEVEAKRAILGFLLSDRGLFPDYDALRNELNGSAPFREMDPAYLDGMAKDLMDLRGNPDPELRAGLFKKYGAA